MLFRVTVFGLSANCKFPRNTLPESWGAVTAGVGCIMHCDNLVVLEILGSIIFVTACIMETTALQLDTIVADHASETALTIATMAHWTSIPDNCNDGSLDINT